MSNIIEIKVEELNALPATKIVENENVQTKFIQMYNAIWVPPFPSSDGRTNISQGSIQFSEGST